MSLRIWALCGLAGFLFGYDTGNINGVMTMPYFENMYLGYSKDIDGKHGRQPPHPVWYRLPGKDKSLIVGTLSAGTCTGSLIGSDAADYLGRRVALIIACVVFVFGVICQSVSEHMDMLSMGRFVTGVGMGMVSTVVILYMCEIIEAPKRGLLVAWYQLWIALGLLVSACVNLATMDMWNTGSFRIPISLQSAWGAMLGVGLFFLPESPRWYVKMGKPEKARDALARLRGQQPKAPSVSAELSAITASHEESQLLALPGSDTFVGSWANCFRGGLGDRGSNLRRTLLGATVQLFQQISGVNFIFYFGTAFFKQQRFSNVYVIAVIMSSINVVATFASFWLVDRFQRRTLMIRGALAMGICQMGVAAAGFLWKHRSEEFCEMQRLAWSQPIPAWAFWPTMTGLGAFLVCYAITWGPGAWIVTGEIFPMQIRARGIGIATSTNWFSNTVIAFITPVLYDNDHLNLGSQVFFIWGAACFLAALFSYLCVPETKGLTLEQVDFIFEVAARKSGHEIPPEKRVGSMSTWSSGRRVSVISTATDPTLRV
ncbi:putative MFS monosaccharide transporter [Naviculisporaceae sp. PSN 640]